MLTNTIAEKSFPVYQRLSAVSRRLGIDHVIDAVYWRLHPPYWQSVGGAKAKFVVDSRVDRSKVRSFDDEWIVFEDLLGRVERDDVFYDIGANVGFYTCLVGQEVPDRNVVAFEPHPPTADRLRANLELNGLDATVRTLALGESNRTSVISTPKDVVGTGMIALSDEAEGHATRVVVGDDFVADRELPAPTILKIDVEGAELSAIRGLRETLSADHVRLLYCEIHPEASMSHVDGLSDAEIDELFTILEECDFEITSLYDRGRHQFVRAAK